MLALIVVRVCGIYNTSESNEELNECQMCAIFNAYNEMDVGNAI